MLTTMCHSYRMVVIDHLTNTLRLFH